MVSGIFEVCTQSDRAPEHQPSKSLPGQRELARFAALEPELISHGLIANTSSCFTAGNGAKEMATLTMSAPHLTSTLFQASFKVVPYLDGTFAIKAYGFCQWGVDVSLRQGTRRGTTANFAVLVSVVRVEVGGGERKVGDGERRVGDGGCQGCYDVVRDINDASKQKQDATIIVTHSHQIATIPINCILPDAEVVSWAMQSKGVSDLYKLFNVTPSNEASRSSSQQISVIPRLDFEGIKAQFLAALSADLPPQQAPTDMAEMTPATGTSLSMVGHSNFSGSLGSKEAMRRLYDKRRKMDSHGITTVNLAPQAMEWCAMTRPAAPALSDNNSRNVQYLSEELDREE
ncbi:hypothetical protein TREMEDRAFT_61340 [Tremella mesenterica DSM 1558]|uniref:uncharacterized protein n=1 Tax=Tremella mesenterica (strain ATCC 24925 / CBS 8224 / DSM 1558 / NBRC 9311 / NRRL Y-6157 / RJB 2259-6 / UBC 559-6) TaxID=578456 RepID=UPI0003F4A196|nr:uncharacterized protein TREMEDRAFT_61340 [Tremella mesenterica DSM 1558]EIW70834.1 hypothetical protein TREMEDRAFT_61340 [Tremella mesenterica DSM 1558]